MSEAKTCPKCGGEMVEGLDLVARYLLKEMYLSFRKKGDFLGDRIIPYYCKGCGFVELFKELKEKKE